MSFYDDASLVVIPSGFKTSKVYAEKPTDGSGDLAFTRTGDTATRVNSAGIIEKVRTNIIRQSEAFNTTWTLDGATVTANSTTAPNGTLTADTITGASGNFRVWQNVTGLSSISYTFSVYAKKGTATSLFVDFVNVGDGPSFNFDTKTWSTVANWTTSFQELANGWFRLFATRASNTSSAGPGFKVGGAGQTVFLWGAQMEANDVGTNYIPTTTAAVSVGPVANVPRLDYTGSTCGKLLLEPQRTNLVTYSEQFNNAAWLNAGGTVTSNTATSPDGYQNADTLTGARYQSSFSSNQYTVSCFAKKVDGDGRFTLRVDVPTSNTALFDLNNGTIVSTAAGYTSTITSFGNGWYRCTLTTPASTTINNFVLVSATGSTASTYIWGAQLEVGAYATSYIPTLAASATRGADACSKTGISSLIGQTEGTFYHQFSVPVDEAVTRSVVLSNGTTANRVALSVFSNALFTRVDVGGVNQVNSSATIVPTATNKIAFRYKANDFAAYVNGVKVITDTSGSTFTAGTLNQIAFVQPDSTSPFNGRSNQVLLFTTALTDAELATLTTL